MTPDHSHGGVGPADDAVDFRIEVTEQSIPRRFDDRAGRYPTRVAVQTRERRLTYRELAARVDRAARALARAHGPAPEPVALLLGDDSSFVAMLAVLKAGRCFVPLDRSQPDAAIAAVLEHSGARVLIAEARTAARARRLRSGLDVVELDALEANGEGASSPPSVSADSPAYIVYTGGSTGRPKGVLHTHRSVLHNVFVHSHALGIGPHDRHTLVSSRATQQAMTGVCCALLNGAALHPFDLREGGLAGLASWLVHDEITIYHSSASVFRELADTLPGRLAAPRLRVVKIGSEPVSRADVERFRARFPSHSVLVNALSATETLTICMDVIEPATSLEGDSAPVGRPVSGVDVSLVDDEGRPVATGEVGEIHVHSRYLAAGYWRDPALTSEKFFPDAADATRRVFRTGDLARVGTDGRLHCVGRTDHRVKIRGNRVETAEVESALMGLDAFKEVAVVGRDVGRHGTRLVAYVAAAKGEAARDARTIRGLLESKLPAYMIPSAFVHMEALPRTPGGKLDRAALPPWQPRSREISVPRDLLETQLATIWEELLGVGEVSIDDDFFELGGDSLLAVEMALRVEQSCGARVNLQDLFGAMTIERLAHALASEESQGIRTPLSALHAEGDRRPLFFAHGAIEGGGFYCRGLARALGEDQPLYVIHPHGLDGAPVPRTIEEMAQDRLRALLECRPGGPYALGGFCAGGAVAFEMARRLERLGHRVDIVLMIDAHARNARFRAWNRLVGIVSSVLRLSPDARRALFRRGRRFLRAFRQALLQGAPQLILFVLKKPYTIVAEARERRHARPRDAFDFRQTLWLKYHDALEDYVPGRYHGRVVLLRSSHLDERAPGNHAAGWQHVCDRLDVRAIAGDHLTCVTTHVDRLAEEMRPYL